MDEMSRGARWWRLFKAFFKIGAFTFGGGYAMIPLIHREVVEAQGWISDEDMVDLLAISESTPGPLAVNAATFIGYKVAGVGGAAFATLGVALPSVLIISLIAQFYDSFRQNRYVAYAFEGIRVGVVVLIVNAVLKLSKSSIVDAFCVALMAVAFIVAVVTNVNVILILLCGGLCGLVYQTLRAKRTPAAAVEETNQADETGGDAP